MIQIALGLAMVTGVLAREGPAPDASIVIERVTLFDSVEARWVPDRTIVITGERITAVAGPETPVEPPAGARKVDGKGRYVIPGLIDAHVHLVHVLDFAGMTGDAVLPLYLAAGVTSIRSTGDEIVAATLVARAARSRPDSSPRVFTCTGLLDRDPPIHADVGRAVRTPGEVPAILDEYQRWGVTTAKIYAGTGREVGRAIIEAGHERKLFVTAHLGAYRAQDAVADGVDGLEHIESVFHFCIPGDAPADRGRLDLSNPVCEELTRELARRRTFVDPTLVVFRNMLILPDLPEIRDHPDQALAPARLRRFWPIYSSRTGCPHGGALEDRKRLFAKYQELTGKLHRAGVPLLVGTDSPEPGVTPGFSIHQELELLVESGLTPAEALQAATSHNARALGRADQLGSVAPGKLADLVVLAADPLADIRNTRAIEFAIRGGLLARPADLLAGMTRDEAAADSGP